MKADSLKTFYASPERVADNELLLQIEAFKNKSELITFLDTIPEVYLILNRQRQIVFVNKSTVKMFNLRDSSSLMGKRPGEILRCKHAFETESGCGTSEACSTCGAVNAIIKSLDGEENTNEFSITNLDGDASNFRVWTSPYDMDKELFSLFTVSDISNEKRRNALERIFFHDIMNTASGLWGYSSLIRDEPDNIDEYKDILYSLSEKLIDEIKSQIQLTKAENNQLQIQTGIIDSIQIIKKTLAQFKLVEDYGDRSLKIDHIAKSLQIISDEALLQRVLSNMVKNAIEASSPGDTITIGCYQTENKISFWVHNPNFMPRKIQLQLFNRSFSTKGADRGLGTYSMKLLSERYLSGTVSFTSDEAKGTTFTASYPIGNQI